MATLKHGRPEFQQTESVQVVRKSLGNGAFTHETKLSTLSWSPHESISMVMVEKSIGTVRGGRRNPLIHAKIAAFSKDETVANKAMDKYIEYIRTKISTDGDDDEPDEEENNDKAGKNNAKQNEKPELSEKELEEIRYALKVIAEETAFQSVREKADKILDKLAVKGGCI